MYSSRVRLMLGRLPAQGSDRGARQPRSRCPACEDADDANDADGDEQSDSGINSVMRRLNEAAAWWEWRALGLDPDHDGPDRVEVRRVERVTSPVGGWVGDPPEC